jgi:hypothetical protein
LVMAEESCPSFSSAFLEYLVYLLGLWRNYLACL